MEGTTIQSEALTASAPSVHLVATNPTEMAAAQDDLKNFLVRKIEALDVDITDLNVSISKARESNWSAASLERLRTQAVDDQEFYAKIFAAVEAGYTIVPDFPVDVFAIRISREEPQHGLTTTRYGRAPVYLEQADILPAGEGDYVSSTPRVVHTKEMRKEKDGITDYELKLAEPVGFRAVVFPLRAARVEVMNATAEAMTHKIFDQIGICPRAKKPDPLILGQIVSNKGKLAIFLIAWHLNLREL
jgi:hypothetical protein